MNQEVAGKGNGMSNATKRDLRGQVSFFIRRRKTDELGLVGPGRSVLLVFLTNILLRILAGSRWSQGNPFFEKRKTRACPERSAELTLKLCLRMRMIKRNEEGRYRNE